MAYFDGRSVTISNPVAARVLVLALSAWIDGKPQPPGEIRLLMTELHWLADETSPRHNRNNDQTSETAPVADSFTIDAMTAGEILGVTPQMIGRYCADGTLLAAKAHGSWAIDAASVNDLAAERRLKSG